MLINGNMKKIITIAILIVVVIILFRTCVRVKEVELKQTDSKTSLEIKKEKD